MVEVDNLTKMYGDMVAIDGVLYGGIEATLDRVQGANVWLVFAIRELSGQTPLSDGPPSHVSPSVGRAL